METEIFSASGSYEARGGLDANYFQARWYAAHTRARHEKCVNEQLALRFMESFLPVCDSIRRWKDRRIRLQLPLFPGYVFVRVALRDRLQVLQIPGIVRLVGFNGVPAPLEDDEIGKLRRALADGVRVEPHPYLSAGRRVRIREGALAGCEGILKRWKGGLRVVMSIELIERSISLEIDAASLEPTKWRGSNTGRK
jgi:transcription antitermination factor NusG